MEHVPTLPVTWRPRRGRIVSYGFAVFVVAGSVVLALLLPASFHLPDRLGIIVFCLLVAGLLHVLARSRVEASAEGVTVVNPTRTHRLAWAEIVDVRFVRGDSWPRFDLSDGDTLGALGIQSADGDLALQAVADLRALIRKYGEADEPRHDGVL
ncbi:PH domain-containing protein [Bailinhaonella thermotolerans]|uniref:PH domain-containing protein n=1 Tax=Bailinhaonella thermotolerans TaxID=1070861 RepID=A0A3A4ASP4_9ACTN|nr:PH domain-containing protein [Bailinhaonella thermotolerans]RJL31335.1 PH domain-containing protein [Bailinhaonella thermotolerans]